MPKKSPRTQYVCSNCSYSTLSWQGKCPQCGQWNTLDKITEPGEQVVGQPHHKSALRASALSDISEETLQNRRILLASNELNDFFAGGIAHDSITLLAGEPGLGKSTLALQFLKSALQKDPGLDTLYVTAEESIEEVAKRAKRLFVPGTLMIVQSQKYESIEQEILKRRPNLVIIDSVQTIYSSQMDSNPGSVAQVTNIVTQLLALCKSESIAVILIGHVTKEGSIAGPRTLEHLVDAVLMLERNQNDLLMLNFVKYRFGSTEQILFLKMAEAGLAIIVDPSLLMLENLENGIGISYGLMRVKNQSMVVEIQALVAKNMSGIGFQRQAIAVPTAKLNSLIAICKKYLFLDLDGSDIYINAVGIPRGMSDESLDLAIVLALLSSYYDQPLTTLLQLDTKKRAVFAGRITLSGSLRSATSDSARSKNADRLKMLYNPTLKSGELNQLLYLVKKV